MNFRIFYSSFSSNPLNSELNPICHLLLLLGAHHILHVSRIRVNKIKQNIMYTPSDTAICLFYCYSIIGCGPGSSVGIVTGLQAGWSGIESRWRRDFLPVQTDPVAHPASCKMGNGSFPGGKMRPGRAADHSPRYSAAVIEE